MLMTLAKKINKKPVEQLSLLHRFFIDAFVEFHLLGFHPDRAEPGLIIFVSKYHHVRQYRSHGTDDRAYPINPVFNPLSMDQGGPK